MVASTYYSEEQHGPHEYFELGDVPLIQGETLKNARLAYKTQGNLNEAKDNVILFPHMWSGTSASMEIFFNTCSVFRGYYWWWHWLPLSGKWLPYL